MADKKKESSSIQVAIVVGVLLIVFGLWKFAEKAFPPHLWYLLDSAVASVHMLWGFTWPILLVVAGGYLVWAAKSGRLSGLTTGVTTHGALHRSRTDKRFLGVCGGIAYYFRIDSTVVRVVFVLLFLVSPPTAVIAYLLMGLVLPQD